MKWFLSLAFLLSVCNLFAQPDYWAAQTYFSGCPVNHIPKGITIPDKDRESREIINSIINGHSYSQLLKEFPEGLGLKLGNLISGQVIAREGDGFKVLFPVIADKKRAELEAIIHERLTDKQFSIDTIIDALRLKFSKNPDMIFHFLWSRIIDDCWWDLYNETFNTDKGPPGIAFIVYPPHPFQCGTNSDYSPSNDMFAMSWSYNIFNESFSVPPTKSFFSLAANDTLSEADRAFFRNHGLLDSANRSALFTYCQGDPTDQLCDALKRTYIQKMKGLFDYRVLSGSFKIPEDELFIVCSHEIAYEILRGIDDKKQIFIPITKEGNPDINLKYLVSIRYQR